MCLFNRDLHSTTFVYVSLDKYCIARILCETNKTLSKDKLMNKTHLIMFAVVRRLWQNLTKEKKDKCD